MKTHIHNSGLWDIIRYWLFTEANPEVLKTLLRFTSQRGNYEGQVIDKLLTLIHYLIMSPLKAHTHPVPDFPCPRIKT